MSSCSRSSVSSGCAKSSSEEESFSVVDGVHCLDLDLDFLLNLDALSYVFLERADAADVGEAVEDIGEANIDYFRFGMFYF